MIAKVLVIGISCLLLFVDGLGNEPAENRLHHELLTIRTYSNLIRPVSNNSIQLTVKLGLRLSQLLDMVCEAIRTMISIFTLPHSRYLFLKYWINVCHFLLFKYGINTYIRHQRQM